ncbi:MAG: phosphoserine phosphatase SerB [Acidimicrobiia bacterium]|nr:phosphoserine phosphatase SerB [Acidimicrobiia bacterium]
MSDHNNILIRVSGTDRPGITAGLLSILASEGGEVLDMEQVVVRDHLMLSLLVSLPERSTALKDLLFFGWERSITIEFDVVESDPEPPARIRHAVTVLGEGLSAMALAGVAEAIAGGGGNIDRIFRLSRYPVYSYELVVSGGDVSEMRPRLLQAAADHRIDVAIQREGLERRAKRLVLIDVDSTLIQDEVIDLLAEEAGITDQVAAITERAMAGELDFGQALAERVGLLAGLDVGALERVRAKVRLTPGARTFVRTLHRLGYVVAAVSGGFSFFVDELGSDLGLDHVFSNTLEVADGVVTGKLAGTIVDRARKADILREVAAREAIPVSQTVAVGDGANDLDMLEAAGLGIAFNAKPVVKEVADTSVNVPYLDAILFVLGIRREDVEAADAAGGDATAIT